MVIFRMVSVISLVAALEKIISSLVVNNTFEDFCAFLFQKTPRWIIGVSNDVKKAL